MDCSPPPEKPRRRRWRGRLGATVLSAAAHTALAVMLLIGWGTTAAPPALQPAVDVSLVPALPMPPKPPAPPAPARKRAPHPARRPATAPKLAAAHAVRRHKSRPPPMIARRSAAPPTVDSPPAAVVEASEADAGLTDAQLAGAQAAGEGDGDRSGVGGGGGDCDMARRVQAALRKDPLARAAVHAAGGRAIMIWNGDWVRSSAEDGKGLAAVREAITFEVAFAPPACRHQRVRGLIVLSLADGSPRLALGAGDWRWSDLLGLR